MAVRQEQIAFVAAAALVGVLVATNGEGSDGGRRGSRPGGAPDLDRFPAPDAAALTDLDAVEAPERALFSPPRETRPLDPLEFDAPPLPRRIALAPPPDLGPAARHFARFLQTVPPSIPTPGLFDVVGGELSVDGQEVIDELLAALEQEVDVSQLNRLGYAETDGADAQRAFLVENEFLDAEERRQREQSYYRLYDSIRVSESAQFGVKFGRIENDDPYSLGTPERATEAIRFTEYDPDEGRPRFGNSPPIDYERTRVNDWKLAETLENGLRQRDYELRGTPSPATIDDMLELAGDCLAARLEFLDGPRMAEALYERVAAARPDDPRPGVGLARTYEASFDFERALGQYQALLERFPARAEVLAGLARLEARFRLFDEAEERLREAIERDRGNYLGHYELGRLMLELDRPAEAVEALSRAFTRLPSGTGAAGPRHAVRLALGRAHLTLGQVPEATEVYRDAVNARDDSQEALAGLAACALLGDAQAEAQLPGWLLSGGTPPSESFEAVGFDLLLVGGLLAIRDGRLSDAVNGLREALVADPLRAAAAHRALAWAAEIAGEDDAAIEAIEVALVSDPTDVWSHYTRGRLLLDRDDTLEAAASFRRALELESDFEDALAGLGEIAWRDGESEAAELFFERVERLVAERARAVEAGAPVAGLGGERRADIQALRGMNLLNLGEFLAARDIFEGVLIDRTGYGPALAGAAWATYRLDDVEEALIQFRGLDDSLRSRPEDDPLRVWSRQQLERVSEHVAKDLWSDRFEYSTLGNGWERVEAAGPQASLQDGELVLSGNFRKVGEARYQRLYEAAQFISIQARIKVSGDSNARTGLFVSREMGRGQGTRIQAYAAVARSRDGTAQVRTVVPGREESDWADLPRTAFPFPADEWMTLAIERRGEGASTTVTLFMDGIPVLEEVPMTNLARGNNALQVGVFAEGDTGRRVEVRMDDVEVVRTQGGR